MTAGRTRLCDLCGIKGESREVLASPSAAEIRALVTEHAGFGLVEPDLPIGKLALPRDPVERAVLALVTRGAPRALLFVQGSAAKLARVRDERALDASARLVREAGAELGPLFEAATHVLRERGAPVPGRELLREARARRGAASTRDAADLGRAIVRAWYAGLIELE